MIELLQDQALFRLLLVLSIGVAFAVYTRLHLVGGGSVAGGYIAILVVLSAWSTLLGTIVVTGLTLAVMRGVLLRILGIPRSWQFVLSVLVGSVLTAVLDAIVPPWISLGEPLGLAVTFGAFVIPGMLAYDVAHQGFARTMLALGLVTGITLLICVPLFLLMHQLPTATDPAVPIVEGIPLGLIHFAAVAVIVVGAVLRFWFNWRSGGFIGALFIVEFFSIEAFIAVGLAALATQGCMWVLERRVVFTMRQRSMVAMMLGALVAWAGLYWGGAIGWVPAQEANLYTLSPLLATGLLAADMGRTGSDTLRSLLGMGVAAATLSVLVWVAENYGLWWGTLGVCVVALGFIPAALALRQPWRAAEASGKVRLVALGRDPGPVAPPA